MPLHFWESLAVILLNFSLSLIWILFTFLMAPLLYYVLGPLLLCVTFLFATPSGRRQRLIQPGGTASQGYNDIMSTSKKKNTYPVPSEGKDYGMSEKMWKQPFLTFAFLPIVVESQLAVAGFAFGFDDVHYDMILFAT